MLIVARRNPLTGGYTILGRVDDMLNVSGHLIGTTQIETALMAHPRKQIFAVYY